MSEWAAPSSADSTRIADDLSRDPGVILQTLVRLFPHLGNDSDTALEVTPIAPPRGLEPAAFATLVYVLDGCAIFALRTRATAEIRVENGPWLPMNRVEGSSVVYLVVDTEQCRTYRYSLRVGGLHAGTSDFPAYGRQSFRNPAAQQGSLSTQRLVQSRIYPDTQTPYWIYSTAGVNPLIESPVMVWLDGQNYIDPIDGFLHRMKVVADNLTHEGALPPMVHLLVSPGSSSVPIPQRYANQTPSDSLRSLQYDTVSSLYGRHLLEEVLPDAQEVVRLRTDAYSRGAFGLSSGGIGAFSLGWNYPERFSRIGSGIGSFTALRWDPDSPDSGGFLYPFLVRREERKNLRVWISDGAWDIDVTDAGRHDTFTGGSWPLANLSLAQSLNARGYDYRLRFGDAGHNYAQTGLDLPEILTWLWRDYDPSLRNQEFSAPPQRPFRFRLADQ